MQKYLLITLKKTSLLLLFLFLTNSIVFAQWTNNPSINTIVSTSAYSDSFPSITADGTGGTIITWCYGQYFSYDIYAQRLNANGDTLWQANGDTVCFENHDQRTPSITGDGHGGAFIAWVDFRNDNSDNNYDIYAQRINSNGKILWDSGGVPICTSPDIQDVPLITSDSAGGAIIIWIDYRNGYANPYTQRINSKGDTLWKANGVPVCNMAEDLGNFTIASDGNHGAIIAWDDFRNDSLNVYAQRINGSGKALWTPNGIAICRYSSSYPTITSLGKSGAIIAWSDGRNTLNFLDDIYAQRIDSSGNSLWKQNGVLISTHSDNTSLDLTNIVRSGNNDAIIVWEKDTISEYNSNKLYAQKIGPNGSVLWNKNGILVAGAKTYKDYLQTASNNKGGAVITWTASRDDWYKLFAQCINEDGSLPSGLTNIVLSKNNIPGNFKLYQNFPNPFNPSTTIRYDLLKQSKVVLKVYNILGQEVATLVNEEQQAGVYKVQLSANKYGLVSGVYIYRITAGKFNEAKKLILLK